MRHVLRTFRVDIDWLFERVREDPGIYMKYVNTKNQLADMLTKGSFTAAQWTHLCQRFSLGSNGGQEGELQRSLKRSKRGGAPGDLDS